MATTIYDIARELQLSHTTVSRVLNGRASNLVSEATRLRVQETAQRLAYRPHASARALATGQTFQIGILVRHLNSSYYTQALRQTERQVRQSDYQALLTSLEFNTTAPSSTLASWQVDGMLVFEAVTPVLQALREIEATSRPVVGMGGFDYSAPHLDFVGVDLVAGARAATEHLLTQGCRRIAYIAPSPDQPPTKSQPAEGRQRGYEETMHQAGEAPEFITLPSQQRDSARQGVRAYVEAHGCPEGLFCFNDDVAIGAYRALRDLKIRIPDDVALVGCDGIEDTEYLDAPLTTLIQPLDKVAALAWQFLQQRLKDPQTPLQQVFLQPELVVRESSRMHGHRRMKQSL